MLQLSYYQFIETICKSYKISKYMDIFLDLPCDKNKMKKFTRGNALNVKILKNGVEYPFLIKENKNLIQNPILDTAEKLKLRVSKGIETIEKELNIKIFSCKAKICEGGGWYSHGTRYTFGDIYCEV